MRAEAPLRRLVEVHGLDGERMQGTMPGSGLLGALQSGVVEQREDVIDVAPKRVGWRAGPGG